MAPTHGLAGGVSVHRNDPQLSHIHQFSLTGWRRNWPAVFMQSFSMELNGLVNQPRHLRTCLANSDAPRQIRHVGAIA